MSSIFSYKKSTNSPSTYSKAPTSESVFSYNKKFPSKEENLIPEIKSEVPKSFTQGVAQQIAESEELEHGIERNIARGTSRMGERILGAPGDIASFLKHLSGRQTEEFPLPTSEKLQEKSEKWSGGYTSAETENEKKSDELLGDIASFMTPGGGSYGFARNLGIPIVANLAKEGVNKYIGGDERKSTQAKIGTMIVLDLLANRGKGGAKGFSNRLLNKAEKSIPEGTFVKVPNLEKSLDDLQLSLQKGGKRASRDPALQRVSDIRQRMANGQIDPVEFPEIRKSINESIEAMGGWSVEMPPKIRERAIANLNRVKREVIKAGEEYGSTQNPEFLKLWQQGNEASAAVQQSNVISNFIKKKFGNKFRSLATKGLFGLGASSPAIVGLKGATLGLGGAAILGSAYNTFKIGYRVWKSPVLRKYYENVLSAASQQNAPQMITNLNALDKKLAEEEAKEKKMIHRLTAD